MKITKQQLKQIIKEEIQKLEENPMLIANLQKQLDDKKSELAARKEQTQKEIANLSQDIDSLEAQLRIAKTAVQTPITPKVGA